MRSRLLLILSAIGHPVLLPFILLFFFNLPSEQILFTLLLGLLVPLALLLLLKITFSDPSMQHRRLMYLCFAMVYLVIASGYSKGENNQSFLYFFFSSWFTGMLFLAIVNIWIKVSWHAMAWGLSAWPLYYLFYNNPEQYQSLIHPLFGVLILLLTSSLMLYARYRLKAHSRRELFFGYLFGLIIPYICFLCIGK